MKYTIKRFREVFILWINLPNFRCYYNVGEILSWGLLVDTIAMFTERDKNQFVEFNPTGIMFDYDE